MTPLSFEWQWNSGYFLFMGLLYLALVIVGGGIIYSFIRSWLDLQGEEKPGGIPAKISSRRKYSGY